MKEIKVWPHLTIVAVVCAVAAAIGVGYWMKYRQTASAAESVQTAGRIQRVEGDVAISSALSPNENEAQWATASTNTPFSVGDKIYTRDNSQASLAFSGRNFARLNPNTSLDVLALDRARTQLALRDGSAVFDVGYLDPGHTFEVATPYGAVDFYEPGLYDVGINDSGNVIVSVLSGLAQVVGLGGSGRIGRGEVLTLLGATAANVVLSQVDGGYAGSVVDDYYGYQYPQYYDGRYSDYNVYQDDPYYFDPYRRTVSYQYASSYIPGLYDLDYYGGWQNVSGYGHCWSPNVDAGWAPYQQGYWMNDYPYGLTWVSSEPWGYAPYHYGRWAFVGNRWYWVPDGVNTSPFYSPALVAFLPLQQNHFGWVALAPGDPYTPYYYDNNWNPYYFSNVNLVQPSVINQAVPGAVAVLPIDQFGGFGDHRIRRWDRGDFAGINPVLDPLLLTPLRNAVVNSAWGRGKIDLPPGIAKKLRETEVVVSNAPVSPPFRRDLASRMRIKSVPDQVKDRPFKVKDERPGRDTARVASEERRAEPVQVDRQGRQPIRGAERQQQREQIDQRQFRPEGSRVGNPGRGRAPEIERPQMRIERPQARPERPQMRVERPQTQPQRPQQQMRIDRPQAQPQRPQQQLRVERPQAQPQRPQQQMRIERPQAQPQRPQQQLRIERPQAQPQRPQQQLRIERPQAQPQRPQQQLRIERPQAQPAAPRRPDKQPAVTRSAPAAQPVRQPAAVERRGPPAKAQQRQQVQSKPAPTAPATTQGGGKGKGKKP
jgi:FecR protein